ncbi:MAG: hypothetical protein ACI84D_003140 [Thalassolituus oleivorans]|jgi:hypothetical protein
MIPTSSLTRGIERRFFAKAILGLVIAFSAGVVGNASAQCTTPTAPGAGDGITEIGPGIGQGTYFTADCSGNLDSISFNVADKKAATTAEVHLYADQPSGIMVLFAKQTFTPVNGLNTVVIASQPAILSGSVYSFVVANADAPMDVEQLFGGQGIDCPAGVSGSCTETGASEIPFSMALPTPELDMLDTGGPFASDDASPAGTDRDIESVDVGSSGQSTVTIENNGTGILMVTSISFGDVTPGAGAMYSAWPPSIWVPVGGTRDIVITFSPTDAGVQIAAMAMVSDDPDESPTSFHVTGTGLMDMGDLASGHNAVTLLGSGDAARHAPLGPILGAVRDTESDGQTSIDAGRTGGGDDGGPLDDEDGITFFVPDPDGSSFSRLIDGSTVSVNVELSGASSGYLQGWVDANGNNSFLDAGENVITNEALSAGDNLVTFTLPAGTATAAGLRFRVTSAMSQAGSLVEVGGFQPDGEVEDYTVDIMAAAAIHVEMNTGSGRLDFDGVDVVYTDDSANVIFQAPATALTSLDVAGWAGSSILTVSGAMATAGIPLMFDGGSGFNSLVIEDAAGVQASVAHLFSSATAGSITVGTGPTVIGYDNLSPIVDNLSAIARSFEFSSALAETMTLSDSGDGGAGNGYSHIDSDVGGESLSFKNPTTSLSITSSGGGAETFEIGSLDTPLAGTFSGLTVNGGASASLFSVTPSATYSIEIDGGAPAGVCPGDALTIDSSGGALVSAVAEAAGSGSVSFSTGHADILFNEIESIGGADVSIGLNYSTLYATAQLSVSNGTELIVTATNNGPSDVNCVTVIVDAALADWLASSFATSPSVGSFTDPVWTIPTITSGGSETLTISGFANQSSAQEVTFTSSATQDSNPANDSAVLDLSMGFAFPEKAHVNAAIYYNKTTSEGTYEALMVGLYLGSPGITGAVWCKIPELAVGEWPRPALPVSDIGDLWRPCSSNLPFPLLVNDLFEDSSGVLWLGSWGSQGLYRSDDGGESWTTPGGFSIVYAIAEGSTPGILYLSADNGLVFRSLDGGSHWHQEGSLPGVSADTPWSLVSHPSVAGVVYAGLFGRGVYVSRDYASSWEVLDDTGTGTVENDALLNIDNTGDDFAGHVFDLEFSPNANYLYTATGKGVWRANLTAGPTDFTGTWTQIGPTVTLSDASVATPEIRSLTFATDSFGDEDLIVGSWGFGAFAWDTPNAGASFTEFILKTGNITFLATSMTGLVFMGTSDGGTVLATNPNGASTASQHPADRAIPSGYTLEQNYPNPFNPQTTIGFELPQTGHVRLAVFDTLGREVALLVDGTVQAGSHEVQFSARDLPTGTYLYRLSTQGGAIARTLVLMK